jgi:hypothetical protein
MKKSGAARASTDFHKYDKFYILKNLTKTPRPWLSPELTGCVPGKAHVLKGEVIIASSGYNEQVPDPA